ncbi:MAG: hypothetical protein HZB83_02470 [Deltaproteobacteria bacterium]|nr:hypothetical protein [Deltaproteobacteria bacterium]
MISIFTNIPAILASIGLILATSSLISGLQLARGAKRTVDSRIHRFNGYINISIFIILAVLSFRETGLNIWTAIGWPSGLFLILLKLMTVKVSRKKRRAFKYVSSLGGMLILMWLYLLYTHLPL